MIVSIGVVVFAIFATMWFSHAPFYADAGKPTPPIVSAMFLNDSKGCPGFAVSWTDDSGSYYRCRETDAEIEAILAEKKVKNPVWYVKE